MQLDGRYLQRDAELGDWHLTGKTEAHRLAAELAQSVDLAKRVQRQRQSHHRPNPTHQTYGQPLYQNVQLLLGWKIPPQNDLNKVQQDIAAYSYNDDQTAQCIKDVFEEFNYVLCPHTAVGYMAMDQFVDDNDLNPYYINSVILATAHPVKFGDVVEPLIGEKVEIPERLESIINGKKKSINMSANFDIFKMWLMDK